MSRLARATLLSLLAAAACGASALRAPVPVSPSPLPLGPARSARIQAGYDGLAHALAAWHPDPRQEACLLTFTASDVWSIGCPAHFAARGFVPTGEMIGARPVLWTNQPFTLERKRIAPPFLGLAQVARAARDVVSEQDRTLFPLLVMLDWDVLHTTNREFQQSNVEEWLSFFVHESFHVHQYRQPAVQAAITRLLASDRVATKEDLAAFFRAEPRFKAAVTAEYDLLRAAVNDPGLDAQTARVALGGWLALEQRRARELADALEARLPGGQARAIERFYLFLEGTARYVEAGFLADPGERDFTRLAGEATWKAFAATKGKPPSDIPGLGTMDAKYVYAIGMYLGLLLDQAAPDWKGHLFDGPGLLVAQVERAAAAQ